MAEPVVQQLEAVEGADDEAERAAIAQRTRDLGVEPLDEGPAVAQAREWIVVGEEAQLPQMRRRHERGSGLVRKDAQRLELLLRREQAIFRLVGPDEADDGAGAVAERHEQPVTVPGARTPAVAMRDIRDARAGDPLLCLVVRKQEAARHLERRIEQRLYVTEHELGGQRRPVELP